MNGIPNQKQHSTAGRNGSMEETVEKRKQARVKLKGYIADIADGHFIYGGIVEDISLEGLRLNDLPDKFAVIGRQYSIMVSGGPDCPCYKLKVSPCWRKKNGFLLDVGFKIVENPANWHNFVRQLILNKRNKERSIWEQYADSGASIS
jgi:hypothetical protein